GLRIRHRSEFQVLRPQLGKIAEAAAEEFRRQTVDAAGSGQSRVHAAGWTALLRLLRQGWHPLGISAGAGPEKAEGKQQGLLRAEIPRSANGTMAAHRAQQRTEGHGDERAIDVARSAAPGQ